MRSSPSTWDETLVILTARMGSERFPGKVMEVVGPQPLLGWAVQRWGEAGLVVVATSDRPEDDEIARWCERSSVLVVRGPLEDVLGRILWAGKRYGEGRPFWLRGLVDCPFPEPKFIRRAVDVMSRLGKSMFLWALPPFTWPVYGAREFPLHASLWRGAEAVARGDEREHPDLFFHRNRVHIDTVYHEPPPHAYFRPYRLEVDWPEDLELLREIWRFFRRWPSLAEVLSFLDEHPEVAGINQGRPERTGPYTSYGPEERKAWSKDLDGKPIVLWDDRVWQPRGRDGRPIFCNGGCCLVGYYREGWLFLPSGVEVRGQARLPCPCGSGRHWRE